MENNEHQDLALDDEAAPAAETEKVMSMNLVVSKVCGICEQSLHAALHSAGMSPEDQARIVSNYHSNVEKSFKLMRGTKYG